VTDEFEQLRAQAAGDPLSGLLEEAVALARQAGELTLGYFRSAGLAVEEKKDGSPVTRADREAERLIREALETQHPSDGIVGEEEGVKPGESGRRWFVDPIDGTIAFTRGVGTYTNLLALEDGDGIVLGVINVPALGETVYAARGLGCYWNGERARVSRCGKLEESYLATSAFDNWEEGPLLALKRAGVQLRTWADGFGYALVATGRVDAMTDMEAESYDLAPMPVIVSEAGGRFSDLDGSPRHDGGSSVASNGLLHEALLRILAPPGAPV
jgi:histidinol phosphatase-like enzyme (inositol monophosphatase family)